MVQFRPAVREIVAKIVYYGPSLGGKTTNLRMLWEGYPPEVRGELIVLPTGADRTIFFDYLPLTFHKLRGFKLRIQLYTVPGQVRFDSTRQVVLKGVDGIVFVADSQRQAAAANKESWLNLKKNLSKQGLFLDHLPHVLQYNKRDLADIIPVEDLDAELNEYNAPFFEAVAIQGIGVEETLQGIVRLVIRSLRDRFNLTLEAPGGLRPSPVSQAIAPQTPERSRDEQQTGRVSVIPFAIPPPEVTPPTLPLVKPTGAGKVPDQVELTTSTGAARASAEKEPASEAAYPSEGVGSSEGGAAPLGVTSAETGLPKVPFGVEVSTEGAVSLQVSTSSVAQEAATIVPADLTSSVFEATPFPTKEAAPSQEPWMELPPPPGEGEIRLAQSREDAATMSFFSGKEASTAAPETTTLEEPFSLVGEPQAPPAPGDDFAVASVEPIFVPEKGEVGETSTVDQQGAAADELEPGSQCLLSPEAVAQPQEVEYGESAFGKPVENAEDRTSAPGEAFPFGSGELPVSDPFPMAPVASAGPQAGEDVFAIVPAPSPELVPPKVTLEKVLPKVVARHGEVRELEVEIPVPAVWVGGRRVALQLRLILVPEEENHEP